MNFQDDKTKTVVTASQGFERHGATVAKARQLSRQAATKSAAALPDSLPVYGPSMPAIVPVVETVPAKAAVAETTLRINIVSEVTEQTTLAVFSGDELLLTTPLKPEQIGDTLRFNCPIVAGEHALRVVLYRADKTVFMHKENKSELHADGANTHGSAREPQVEDAGETRDFVGSGVAEQDGFIVRGGESGIQAGWGAGAALIF